MFRIPKTGDIDLTTVHLALALGSVTSGAREIASQLTHSNVHSTYNSAVELGTYRSAPK